MSINAPGVRRPLRHLLALTVATVGLLPGPLNGQILDEPVKGFQVADHDKETGKRKWVLSGETAQNFSNDQLLLTGARIEFFDDKGSNHVVVVTPKCVYNTRLKQVTSSEALKVSTGDGRFSIEGLGFDFQQSDSSLNISNQVHATIQKDVSGSRLLSSGSTNSPPISSVPIAGVPASSNVVHIFADRFRFETNRGVFRDNVRVNDPQGTLTCVSLTVQFTDPSRQLERIIADQQVVVESGATRATGDRGIYELAKDEVTLTGNPAWRLGAREGRAEELIFERKTKHFRALRNVRMRLPPGTFHQTGFLLSNAAATPSSLAGRRPVEVECDELEFISSSGATDFNATICRGKVKVEDERGTLHCAVLTIETAVDNNRTERVVAERDVVVEQGEDRVACDRASYFAGEERIEMEGHPNWWVEQREGKADRLSFDLKNRTYRAGGSVYMRLPAGATGRSPWLFPTDAGTKGEGDPQVELLSLKPVQRVEITSDDFEFRSAPSPVGMDVAVYRGRVRVRDPGRMDLNCGVLTGKMFPGSSRMQSAVAEQDVFIQAIQPNGERVGRGDIATYTAENEEVVMTGDEGVEILSRDNTGESRARGKRIVYSRIPNIAVLSGDPRISSPRGDVTGDTVILDLVRSNLTATGNWKIRLSTNAMDRFAPDAKKKLL